MQIWFLILMQPKLGIFICIKYIQYHENVFPDSVDLILRMELSFTIPYIIHQNKNNGK